MGTAVLVHGAWQGSWCWDRIAPLLEEAGHDVATPTLTGSGSRASEMSPEVNLATHVGDVVECIEGLGSERVVLVGHSYAGMVLPGVVDALPDRVATAVFVDAFYPTHGQAALDMLSPPFQERFRQQAAEQGDGWRLPASDALLDVWGLRDPEDRRWVRERLTDWSLRCFESPSDAPDRRIAGLARWYVSGTEDVPSRAVFGPVAEIAAADGCTVVDVPTGHDVMVEAPDALATVVLDALAAGGG